MTVSPASPGLSDSDLGSLVEPERVHRRVYADPDVFELEMDRIFGRTWIYVGHDSQVPQPGDYFTTQVGRQPVVMTRHTDDQIYVLENRCPHKGALVCPERSGHADRFMCMYHGWRFSGDGSLRSVPVRSGYEGSSFDPNNPANGMKRLPRVENYRGFVFASLVADGPDLRTWAGEGLRSFDSMVDRAPDGAVEVIGDCYRTVQNSNWKIFVDNMSDGMHTSFVHHQSARAAKRSLEKFKVNSAGGLEVAALLAGQPDQMAKIDLVAHPNGHFDMKAFAPDPTGPDGEKYKASLIARHGKEGAEAILQRNFHNALIFPTVILQSSLQQLRAIRPLSVDKTLLEIWIFRLKGAPDSFTSRAITAANTANSPSNIVAADDFESYYRCHAGLVGPESEWVLLSREANRDVPVGTSLQGLTGNSEVCMRNMYQAWRECMTAQ
ncbi:aromatic ring-hydroxylating dioxygenase subunit alpha [Streptomyces sp. NL15-2K]|uniref:aromatic ring-hydroxylating oxygenase subunit alpha n=1 Tax=Streptomyces sp. NL15-2K TaxID=376149 RepID=UPI00155AD3D9|nr:MULTISPECIES: Rieske 2Fe-2S domain-containing protein [Actinomycetes]WKX13305.1 Rieske 2Fe-2S domain-containing protein [Kutzneria buriramensis]